MSINLDKIQHKNLGYFRFKKLGGKYLLTSEVGEYVFLSEDDFKNFVEGRLPDNSESSKELAKKSFSKKIIDMDDLSAKYARKNSFLIKGSQLHIFVLTERCDNKCVYCHASAKDLKSEKLDMSLETARKALTVAFKSPGKYLAIEFQGGEPLLNWSVLKFIVEAAEKMNKKAKKNLQIRLISNFNQMSQERLDFLIRHEISAGTSLDGQKFLHDKNRRYLGKSGGGNHGNVVSWIRAIQRGAGKNDEKKRTEVGCIATVSRESLDYPKEIVDEYIGLGLKSIYIRPLFPLGFSKLAWKKVGYSSTEYVEFYKKMLDYVIGINLAGTYFVEKFTKGFLIKILSDHDANMLDLRSPCGAGISMLAYNHDGDVYSCDYGRALGVMGDKSFRIGNVENLRRELIDNPKVKTLCAASCAIGVPGCNECAYLPYCGICPLYNHVEQGNILGQMPTNERCKIHKAVLDYIFEKLQNDEISDIFKRWIRKNA